jgi:hypothetical protein
MGSFILHFGFAFILALLALLVSALILFLRVNANAALKRKVFPVAMGGLGVLFVFLVWVAGVRGTPFGVMVLMTGVICVVNIRSIRFCPACGLTNPGSTPFTPVLTCRKCDHMLILPGPQ